MNEDLFERFKRSKHAHRGNKQQAEIWLLPQNSITEFGSTMSQQKIPHRQGPGSVALKYRALTSYSTLTATTPQIQTSWRLCQIVRPVVGSRKVKFLVTRSHLEGPLTSQQTPTCRLTMSYSARMQFVRCAKLYVTFAENRTRTRMLSKVPLAFTRM
jgi:hypothetical protein